MGRVEQIVAGMVRLAEQPQPGRLNPVVQDDRLDLVAEARRERTHIALDVREHPPPTPLAIGVVRVAREEERRAYRTRDPD